MIDDQDAGEEAALGPSLAMPPLYVLRAADYCPECGQALHVYTLGCVAFHDAEDREPISQFHFLHRIRNVPEPVSALLTSRCPSYYLDHAEEGETPYLMNHCPCGARLDDDFLHGDAGAAFWPDTPDGFGNFRLFRLPVDAIPIQCVCTVGGGEHLNFAEAEPW